MIFSSLAGEITLDADPCLNYDVISSYILNVVLSDGTFTIVGTLNVSVTDLPDIAPVLDNLPDTVNVLEDDPIGTVIFTVLASDGNPFCDTLSFVLTDGGGLFAIDSISKRLMILQSITYIALCGIMQQNCR